MAVGYSTVSAGNVQGRVHTVQATGSANVQYTYNSEHKQSLLFKGFRLDGEYISARQSIPNSVVIPLLDGNSLQLTNNQMCGQIVFNVVRQMAPVHLTAAEDKFNGLDAGENSVTTIKEKTDAGTAEKDVNDLIDLAYKQINVAGGDSLGAEIKISFNLMGKTITAIFNPCTVNTLTPLRVAGNDAPVHQIVFDYGSYEVA